ncbi:MAG: TRAP transporter small permease subunit [Chloroflexota bacterium]
MSAIDRWISVAEDTIVGLTLGVATLATFAEVVARYVFAASVGTGGEVAIFSIIWAAMIGAAVAARTGVHIGVDVLVKKLPLPLAKVMVLVGLGGSAAFAIVVAVLGVELVQASFASGQVTAELLVPRWALYVSVPMGMMLMAYHLIRQFLSQLFMPADQVVALMGVGHGDPDEEQAVQAARRSTS